MENQSSSSNTTISSSSKMQFLLLEQVEFLMVKDDSLLQWELVNVVDAEEEETDDSMQDGFGSWNSPISSPKDAPIEEIPHFLLHPIPADDHGFVADVEVNDPHVDDEEDLDDELVPWDVSNKMGRQRMRKLGKRAFPKMHNSKRNPYLFVTPGCVRGKHGLGLKHNY